MKKVSVFGVFPTQAGVAGYGPYATRKEAEKIQESLTSVRLDDPWATWEVDEEVISFHEEGENTVFQMGRQTLEVLPNGMYQDNVSQYFLDAVNLILKGEGKPKLQRV